MSAGSDIDNSSVSDINHALINATVTGRQLRRLNDAVVENHFDKYEAAAMAFFAALIFKGEGVSPAQLVALVLRLERLSALLSSGAIDQWAIGNTADRRAVAVLFEAAAKATVHITDAGSYFDPAEFNEIALAASKPEGKA